MDISLKLFSIKEEYTVHEVISEKQSWELVKGYVDLHCHCSPEGWIPHRPAMLQASIEASDAGIKAIVFKDHFTMTSDRAWIIQEYLDEWAAEKGITPVQVYGGITLNYAVGGLNPEAVRKALSCDFGKFTKIIYMPSLDSAWTRKWEGREGGITILENGKLKTEVKEIIRMVTDAPTKVCIATSHLSVPEIMVLAEEATAAGVDVIVTHASQELTVVTVEEAKELIKRGAWIELAECSIIGTPVTGIGHMGINFYHSLKLIRELGPSRMILSTDAGQPGNTQAWAARLMLRTLVSWGISEEDVNTIARLNPAKLIGIE